MASVVTKRLGSLQNSYANTRTNGINGYECLVGGEVFWAPQPPLWDLTSTGMQLVPTASMVMNVMVLLVERPSGLPSEQPPLWDLTSTQLIPTASMGMNILRMLVPPPKTIRPLLHLRLNAPRTTLPSLSASHFQDACLTYLQAISSEVLASLGFASEVPTWCIRDRIERFAPSMYQVLRLTKATASGSSLPKTLPISVNSLTSSIHPTTSTIYSSAPSAPGPRRVTITLRPKYVWVLRLTKATASGSSLPKTLPISVNGLTSPICPNTSAVYSSALSAPGPPCHNVPYPPIHVLQRSPLGISTTGKNPRPKYVACFAVDQGNCFWLITAQDTSHQRPWPDFTYPSHYVPIYSSAPSAPEPRHVTMYPIHQFMRCSMVPRLALGSLKYSSGCSQSGLTAPHTMTGPTYRRYENQTAVQYSSYAIYFTLYRRGDALVVSCCLEVGSQKAADTRKANKAAEERKARELQDSCRYTSMAACNRPEVQTLQKRRLECWFDLDAKHTKTKKTEERFLVPIMEGSDDDFTVASKSKPCRQSLRGANRTQKCL
ncbi:hypothetical protein BJV78DRAFT_1159277 [Lactifluus subvellereus]|nr:hypothetical protein BJV78DRAFT_1159277 [Lactifluus subvellereus]